MAEQELAWLASHKEQIAALGEDPNLVKALERELQRSASRARPAPPSYDANQLRLGDDFAARVLPSDAARPPASVWLDTAPPPRAPPPPPRAPPSQTDPRTWTRAVDPASGYAYRYDANGNSVWEHELAPAAQLAAAQPIPPQNRGMSKRVARDRSRSESSASESSYDSSSDSSDDDCCECFRSRPAYKKLSTT